MPKRTRRAPPARRPAYETFFSSAAVPGEPALIKLSKAPGQLPEARASGYNRIIPLLRARGHGPFFFMPRYDRQGAAPLRAPLARLTTSAPLAYLTDPAPL